MAVKVRRILELRHVFQIRLEADQSIEAVGKGEEEISEAVMARMDKATQRALEKMGHLAWLAAATPLGKVAQGLAEAETHDHLPLLAA